MVTLLLVLGALLLAWSNGANDNLKGVATLRGSGVLTARGARWLAAVATGAGCLVSVALAGTLAKSFRGAGLLPEDVLARPAHLAAVGGAAASTVLLATRIGMPTSTTHALLGALLGAALVLAPGDVDGGVLATRFVWPMLASPLVAIALTLPAALVVLRGQRRAARVRDPGDALCVRIGPAPALVPGPVLATCAALPSMTVGSAAEREPGPRPVAALRMPRAIDLAHGLSGASVCFARALNDTPKIAALLLGGKLLGATAPFLAVALAMVLGGLLQSERVAHTISERITAMSPAGGVIANLATAALVLSASKLALPASTTHVSCGALFGLGIASGTACWDVIAKILLAWILTLPTAALLAAAFVSATRACI